MNINEQAPNCGLVEREGVFGGDSPLSHSHLRMLGSSVQTARPIRKASGYARMSGWMTLLAGALSVLFSIGSLPGMVLGLALAGFGMRELGLARRLDRLDGSAPAWLALNQLMLGAVLSAYAVYKVATYDSADSMIAGSLASDPTIASAPELAGTMDQLSQIEYLLSMGIAGVLVVVAIFVQGGTALYYITKRKRVNELRTHCPEWVLRVHEVMSDPSSVDKSKDEWSAAA
jgi:hypothetical protein